MRSKTRDKLEWTIAGFVWTFILAVLLLLILLPALTSCSSVQATKHLDGSFSLSTQRVGEKIDNQKVTATLTSSSGEVLTITEGSTTMDQTAGFETFTTGVTTVALAVYSPWSVVAKEVIGWVKSLF